MGHGVVQFLCPWAELGKKTLGIQKIKAVLEILLNTKTMLKTENKFVGSKHRGISMLEPKSKHKLPDQPHFPDQVNENKKTIS
jgi:hypothetical protein